MPDDSLFCIMYFFNNYVTFLFLKHDKIILQVKSISGEKTMRRIFIAVAVFIFSLGFFTGCEDKDASTIKNNTYENAVKNGDAVNLQDEVENTKKPKAFIDSDDIEWVTVQGGLMIYAKVLFPGHDDEKIKRIVSMINSGTGKKESTKEEISVIHSGARPVGILFKLRDGSKVCAWTDYTSKSFKDGWSASMLDDRFVLEVLNNGEDKYFTIFSKDVAGYIRQGWETDMPRVNGISVSSESKKGEKRTVLREGDTAVVSGDGYTAKEVLISIQRNGNSKESYTVGKVVPKFGQWEWRDVVGRQCKTLDGKTIVLENDLYDITANAEENRTTASGVIDLRNK